MKWGRENENPWSLPGRANPAQFNVLGEMNFQGFFLAHFL